MIAIWAWIKDNAETIWDWCRILGSGSGVVSVVVIVYKYIKKTIRAQECEKSFE